MKAKTSDSIFFSQFSRSSLVQSQLWVYNLSAPMDECALLEQVYRAIRLIEGTDAISDSEKLINR